VQDRFAASPGLAREICGSEGAVAAKKAMWLKLLLNNILGADIPVPDGLLKRPRTLQGVDDGDGSDVHRISSEDLEKIHAQSKCSVLDELLFTLMITTGLRVGAVTLILIASVADVVDHHFVVRTQSRTREKGNKWAHFLLTTRVQELVRAWLTGHRPAVDSPYLFPGATPGGHVTTNAIRGRFSKLCAAAGLAGRQFHPHALRHSFAHMLLEAGNSVDVVSKCLNHSSSAITEAVYLRESATELLRRANIPWLRGAQMGAPSPPLFLSEPAAGTRAARDEGQPDAKRRKASASRCLLDMFNPALQEG
jgi:integrase